MNDKEKKLIIILYPIAIFLGIYFAHCDSPFNYCWWEGLF